MTDDLNRDEAFAEQLAAPLRAELRADASFEARVMSAVHAAAHAEALEAETNLGRSWWRRPFTIRLTPIASLAIAAGFAGLLFVGSSLPTGSSFGGQTGASNTVDTVRIVRFVLVDRSAQRVALVGTFNAWQKTTLLHPTHVDGVWSVNVSLPVGRHEYAFVVWDGRTERWVADPTMESQMDDFGTESSIIAVHSDPAS